MTKYDASNIKNLQFPDSIRAKPGMYIGATDASGVLTVTRELADNFVDEALAGRCTAGGIHLAKDGSIWVFDNGAGIPTGMTKVVNPADGSSTRVHTLRAVYGILHTSGKFSDEAYATSRGSHGVGAKGTNALAKDFEVWTFNQGTWWNIAFRKGVVTKDVAKLKSGPVHPITGARMTKGTMVRFVPDETIFSSVKMPKTDLAEWARMSAYLTPGLRIVLSDASSGKKLDFYFPDGVNQYLNDRIASLQKVSEFGLLEGPSFQAPSNPLYDCAIQFSSYDGYGMQAYTNGLINVEGGHHMVAVLNALRESLQPYVGKKQEFTLNELKDGMIGLINVKLSAPKFDSQTKEKLVDERASAPLKAAILPDLVEFFKKNKKLAAAIVERATKLRQLRTKFVASKQMLTKLRKITQKGLPSKGATAPRCKPEDRELYLLEGDCFLPGTMIHTVNGDRPIEELTEPFVGVAFNPETGTFPHVLMSASFTRKMVTEVVDVEFEDGKVVTCTPEHEWLTVNRGYVAAQDLLPSDMLMTFDTRGSGD